MEGKPVVISVVIMSLVMVQIQLGAAEKACCPSAGARETYSVCILYSRVDYVCESATGCKVIYGNNCPPELPYDNLKSSGDLFNEYCKLGCASYACGAITTLQNSDASEIVNGAVERCTKACSILCTKGDATTVKTA